MSARDLRSRVERRLQKASSTRLRPEQIDQLCAYIGLLAKWNKRLNLTALSVDPPTDEAIDRLLVEPAMAIQAAMNLTALRPPIHSPVSIGAARLCSAVLPALLLDNPAAAQMLIIRTD